MSGADVPPWAVMRGMAELENWMKEVVHQPCDRLRRTPMGPFPSAQVQQAMRVLELWASICKFASDSLVGHFFERVRFGFFGKVELLEAQNVVIMHLVTVIKVRQEGCNVAVDGTYRSKASSIVCVWQ